MIERSLSMIEWPNIKLDAAAERPQALEIVEMQHRVSEIASILAATLSKSTGCTSVYYAGGLNGNGPETFSSTDNYSEEFRASESNDVADL